MAKTRTKFVCAECAAVSPTWVGKCSGCNGWNTIVEELVEPGAESFGLPTDTPIPIGKVGVFEVERQSTGSVELDRVLSGGFVPGSVTLLGGEPGIGKSTLLMQVMAAIARQGVRTLYVTAEESKQQVRLLADRLGSVNDDLWLVAESSAAAVVDHIIKVDPAVVVIDSIQTVSHPTLSAAPGSVSQVRECANRFVRLAKERDVSIVLVGHVTKEGGLAGPRVLEHIVDTVLEFTGDRHHALRMIRAAKHRYGTTNELGLFEMTERGLKGVVDPSSLFLADRATTIAGSAVVPIIEGHRPLLVEVQALVSPSEIPSPRRSAQGLDAKRLAMLLAVLQQRVGVSFATSDVYVSAVGGVRVNEPGADLAIALALASAKADITLPSNLVACGEIGLGGELRNVGQVERRLAEASRFGLHRAIVPYGAPDPPPGVTAMRASTLKEAAALAGLFS